MMHATNIKRIRCQPEQRSESLFQSKHHDIDALEEHNQNCRFVNQLLLPCKLKFLEPGLTAGRQADEIRNLKYTRHLTMLQHY